MTQTYPDPTGDDHPLLRRIVYADEVTLLQQLQQEIEYHYKAPLDAFWKMDLPENRKNPQI